MTTIAKKSNSDTTMTASSSFMLDEINRPSQEEKDSHYKPGSIKRVKLKNFLTYDAVEFFPGPRLNVVVGPNGTGKSTILCAICLGLGGQPPLLGRADDARLFIKHEKEEAMIEIELSPNNDEGDTTRTREASKHVIRRVITRDKGSENGRGAGASTYYINGHKQNLKAVKELVSEKYMINIDNLCTFLPQDKVGSFSGFDKQALLLETEKSLSMSLYTNHMDLIELEKSLQSSGTDVASLEAHLANLKKENERLEREKELMEARQSYLEKIDLLKKKRAWLIFDQKREEAKLARETRDELKKQKKEAEKEIRPLTEKHASVEGDLSHIQGRYKASETKIKKDRQSYDECFIKCDKYMDEVEQEMNDYRTIDATQRRAEKNLEKERLRLEQMEAEVKDYPPMAEIEKTMKETQAEMVKIKSSMNDEKTKASRLNDRIEDAAQKKDEAANRLDRLKDDKKLRLETFCNKFANVGQAYKFIDDNRKIFRKKVWGPVAAEVQPENQLAASYLEQHVANSTWKAYVVECKEDYDLLYREVREKRGISINIIIVNSNGRYEIPPRMYSEERMAILRDEHGFLSYLDETFTAPDIIMQALINKHNVDKVLVGGEGVHNSLERKDLIEFLSSKESSTDTRKQSSCFFYTYKNASFKYTSQVSRYSGEIGTVPDEVLPAKILRPGSDPRLRDQLTETIREADELISSLHPEVAAYKTRYDEMQTQGQLCSQRFKEAKNIKQGYGHYMDRLRNQRDKYQEAQEHASRDNEKEKAKKITKIKKLIESSISSSENAGELHNQIMKVTHTLTGLKMKEDALSDIFRHLSYQLQEKQMETENLANQYKAADAEYNRKKDNLKMLLNEAERIAPKEEWHERLEQDDLPETLEGVEDAIDEAENKVNSITDNPHVMRQYEERKKEIEQLEEQLQDIGGEKDMKKKQLEQKLGRWESALHNILREVSDKFSTYMKEVGCAGEVRLFCGKNSRESGVYNFKDWGVEILVKFREASSLQALSAQTHSGGERSVSTIMYLMGLQNLMASPFRCVDEINQGLDERNERLVFKRIVENSTIPANSSKNSDHCGQYFLITPKLLPNLDGMENEDITVLFVFSGSHNFSNCLDWNIDKFIEDNKRFLSENEAQGGSTSVKKRRIKE